MTHLVLLPIVIPLLGAVVALFMLRKPSWQGYWSLAVLGTAVFSSSWLLWIVWQTESPIVFYSGGWQAPFGIVLVGDLLGALMALMSQVVLLLGAVYALGAKDKNVRYPGFYPLFLMLTTGLTGSFLTGDLFNLFVFAELLVISGTVLTAVSDDMLGTGSGVQIFLYQLAGGHIFAAGLRHAVCFVRYAQYGRFGGPDRPRSQRTAAHHRYCPTDGHLHD